VRSLAVGALRLYKRLVSPLLPPACRYYPSCSEYAAQAIAKHGVLRGGMLAAKRLVKCSPLHPGGYDPVPLDKLGAGSER
jgi:putative membrane protein insertion efficiency factor